MRVLLGTLAALATLLAPTLASAELLFSLDQSNVVNSTNIYNIRSLSPLQQSFMPALGRLNRVDLRIRDADLSTGPGADLQVKILSGGVGETVVGLSDIVRVADNSSDYVTFRFPSNVNLNPGFETRIEVVNLSTGTSTGTYMWTASNGDTYSKGSPSATGVTPVGDFLFRSGLEQQNRLELVPTTLGSVRETLSSGVRTTDPTVYIANLPVNDVDSRGIIEFDLEQIANRSDLKITSAILSGEVAQNNGSPAGTRNVNVEIYQADQLVSISDFDSPGSNVGSVSYDSPDTSAVAFNFDVSSQLSSLWGSGANAVGFRFEGVNTQGYSTISDSIPPILTITVSAVPEPAHALLWMLGGVIMVWYRKRHAGVGEFA